MAVLTKGSTILLLIVKTSIDNKKVFINDILKNIGIYKTTIFKNGYQVIATRDSHAIISFMYKTDEQMSILVGKTN